VTDAGCQAHRYRCENVDTVKLVLQPDAEADGGHQRREAEGERQAVLDQPHRRRGAYRQDHQRGDQVTAVGLLMRVHVRPGDGHHERYRAHEGKRQYAEHGRERGERALLQGWPAAGGFQEALDQRLRDFVRRHAALVRLQQHRDVAERAEQQQAESDEVHRQLQEKPAVLAGQDV